MGTVGGEPSACARRGGFARVLLIHSLLWYLAGPDVHSIGPVEDSAQGCWSPIRDQPSTLPLTPPIPLPASGPLCRDAPVAAGLVKKASVRCQLAITTSLGL